MQNLNLVVFTKLKNSRDDDGKRKSHIVFHCGFYESGVFLFWIVEEWVIEKEYSDVRGGYMMMAVLKRFYLKT